MFLMTDIFFTVNTKIHLVRFGLLEHMQIGIRQLSVQFLKENAACCPQFTSFDDLMKQVST